MPPSPGRFHLHLTLHGQSTMHGWWDDETIARRKHVQTVGEYGQPGAHVTLTDEQTGTVLTEWPEPQPRPSSSRPPRLAIPLRAAPAAPVARHDDAPRT